MILVLQETFRAARRAYSMCEPRQKWALAVAVVLMLVTGALATVPAVVIGALVDDLTTSEYTSLEPVLPYLLAIIAAVTFRELLGVVRKWLVEDTSTRMWRQQTVQLVGHLLCLDLAFFSRNRTGALNGRIHRSVEGLTKLLKLGFLAFFPALITAACSVGVAVWKGPAISGIMGLGLFAGLGLVLWQVSSQRGIRIALLREREILDGTVVETLGGIETVRAANTGDLEVSRIDEVAERLRAREIRHHLHMALFDSAKSFMESGTHVGILGVSVWLAIRGTISVGEVMTFSMLYVNVAAPLRELHRILDEAHESTLRVLDLFELHSHPLDRSFSSSDEAARPSTGAHPAIEFSNVDFTYSESNTAEPAIRDLSLRIEPGEHVGIVGRTGCGKSTLIKLILRLVHRDAGSIRFHGVPIDSVSRETIAAEVGYVSQTPFIFAGSIFENIAYCTTGASAEEVEAAARRAGIHDEIVRELGGYDAMLAERGSNISGGQRQRLVLARLFLLSPRVLILDEATSALDNRTEAAVQTALKDLMAGRTTLTIAHRINTVRSADRILVMDGGRVVEEGSYQELLDSGGRFAELHKLAEQSVA